MTSAGITLVDYKAGVTDTASVNKAAVFSADRVYRYFLMRCWAHDGPNLTFILLNPSTADATQDDPTIRRCIRFAKDAGYGSMNVLNLFAYRATDPKVMARFMRAGGDIVGPDNDAVIEKLCTDGRTVVAAWGYHGRLHERASQVEGLLRSSGCDLRVLHLNADGTPSHPLYLAVSHRPVPWTKGEKHE